MDGWVPWMTKLRASRIPANADHVLWYSAMDEWQFAYRSRHGWITRTRREHWDTLLSTEELEAVIPVFATIDILDLRKDA